MADIFISYSQKDRDWVKRLVDALTAEGYGVWWDLKIRSGESFDRAIERTLRGVRAVVTVWSANSVDSDWVRAEAAWAKDEKKLLSIRTEGQFSLPIQFYHVHTHSMVGWDGSPDAGAFRKLIEDIEDIEDIAGAPLPVASTSGHGSDSASVVAEPGIASPARGREPLSSFRDALRDGGEGPEMVVIPAGIFWMGSTEDGLGRGEGDGPRRQVKIPRPFALGRTPVTFAEYDRFAETTGKEKPDDRGWGRGPRPVIKVAWADAVAYADWLSEQSDRRYRLPSEAEWEYAVRAGSQTRWSFGDGEDALGQYAWFNESLGFGTHPVGEKQANPWGLYDVHGNVWEWVQDCWHDNYEGAPSDGSAWQEASGGDCRRRVVRGGSWNIRPEFLRSAYRFKSLVDDRDDNIGFRLAQDL